MRKILIIFILQIVIFGCKKDESFPLSGNNKSLTVSFFITGAYTTGRDTLYIFENQKKYIMELNLGSQKKDYLFLLILPIKWQKMNGGIFKMY